MSDKVVKRVAADIGGTFTDIAAVTEDGELLTWKLPSTPPNFADAVSTGIEALFRKHSIKLSEIDEVLHGCTVATNAILEQKGAKTALITTKGFRDVLEIQRVRVPKLYDPLYEKLKRQQGGGGCGAISASSNKLYYRAGHPTEFDLKSRKQNWITTATRPGCWINIIPANGLLLVPEGSSGCICSFPVQASMAYGTEKIIPADNAQ